MTDKPSIDPFVAQLAALCREHPVRAKWVIACSHALGHTLGERLALEGANWANLRFVTPFGLALEMAAPFLVERGINPLGEAIGSSLIMRLLAELPADTPSYFRGLGSHPEMATALWASIRELRLSGLSANTLPQDAFQNPAKHAELQALIGAYEAWLAAERRADSADVYAEARLHADSSLVRATDLRVEQPNIIWPPLVRAFLDSLPGERLVAAVARTPGLAVPRRMQDVPREERATASPLAYLMSPADSPAPPQSSSSSLFRAGGAEAEIEEVFRRILHAEGGAMPLDSVEIACASPDYPSLIWQKAQRYGWPLTLAPGVPVTATRPGRALLAWCAWIEAGYPASGLRRLFQSGDIRVEIPDGPHAGQGARLLLDSGATWGRETYGRSLAALAASERQKAADGEEDDQERRARHLRRAGHATLLAAWIDAVIAGAGLPPPDASTVQLQTLVSEGQAFVSRHAAAANELDGKAVQAINTPLDDLRALRDLSCLPSYALDLIRGALEGVTVGADRARPGCLHVSLLPQSGFAGRRHTFVVGLEEGRVFPSLVEDPVLLDEERRRLHPSLATSGDRLGEAVHAAVSRLLVMPRASLSFSCRDLAENRETFPSWLLLQAFRLLQPDREVTYDDLNRFLGDPGSVVPSDPAFALEDNGWWLANLKDAAQADPAPVFKAFPLLAQGARAEEQRAASEFTAFDGFVPAAGKDLDPRSSGRAVSPTALEKAGRCPFAYFLERALRIEAIEEEEPEDDEWLDPATRGTLLHALYADMMRELRRRKATPDEKRDLPWLQARADERLDELRQTMPPPSPEVFDHERLQIQRDLRMFLQIEAEAASKGVEPIAFEVTFGREPYDESSGNEPIGQSLPIIVRVKGGQFALAGRIDRIDRKSGSRYEVVDYKTGSFYRKAYSGIFHKGQQLQLVLYAIAAEELLQKGRIDPKATVTSGRYLFPTVKGAGDGKRIQRPDQAEIQAVLSELLDTIGTGVFIVTPDTDDCKFCEFGAACGGEIANERARQKIGNPANTMLEPFRKLRRHD
jgi:RecB family exonuclease